MKIFKNGNDSFIGFDNDRGRKIDGTLNKTLNGKIQSKFLFEDVLGKTEHQEKGTFESGKTLHTKRNADHCVIHCVGEADAKVTIKDFR